MRLFFSFTIAFLFVILADGIGSAQAMGHSCRMDKQTGGAMDMAGSDCCHLIEIEYASAACAALAGGDCCLSNGCKALLPPGHVAFPAPIPHAGFAVMVEKASFFQPRQLVLIGAHSTGLPPPRTSSAPVYIQHCSFLI